MALFTGIRNLSEIERTVSQLAMELTHRQRYLCSILIFQNPVVPGCLRTVLIRALDIWEAPRLEDPVCKAVLALEYGDQFDPSDHRTRSSFTVLRSLGAMPDFFIAITFLHALSGRLFVSLALLVMLVCAPMVRSLSLELSSLGGVDAGAWRLC